MEEVTEHFVSSQITIHRMHFLKENRLRKICFLHYNDKNLSLYQGNRVEIILWGFNSGGLVNAEQFPS